LSIALVTGAAGHLGANLVRALLSTGRRVRAMVRSDARALDGLDVELVRADVDVAATLAPALREVDVVYHLAGVISIRTATSRHVVETNVGGVRNVARAALDARVRRFIHFSSVHAFDTAKADAVVTERSARAHDGQPAYGRSKWAGEQALAELTAAGLPALTLHPSGVLGPFDFKPSLMGRFLLDLHARRIPCLVRGGFDWLDARDLARTAIAAEEKGRVGESYLVSGAWASVGELASMAAAVTGVPPPTLFAPMWVARLGAQALELYGAVREKETLWTTEALAALRGAQRFDCTKAKVELGHQARPLEETVRDTYSWFEAAGMLKRSAPPGASSA
jgi:dihydroflavonol-4-reductase